MRKPKIFALVGGICRDSLSRKLFNIFKEQSSQLMEFDFFDLSALPFFSQDIEYDPPQAVEDFKNLIRASDGILVVTPEYNRSFPGALKNALDWGSRPTGQCLWSGKPAGLIGTSPGALGTFGAQAQLRQVLSFLDMRIMNQPEFYLQFPRELENGKLPVSTRDFLQRYIEKFQDWVKSHMSE
ncbi:MAG: NAD(P)H-dependent oxidoreductase [Synergistaceae bacterium]|jgi:chromate reductase|nr:NAD(P)H-dependent oxidoreductase [Synergistaceae bacterium]